MHLANRWVKLYKGNDFPNSNAILVKPRFLSRSDVVKICFYLPYIRDIMVSGLE